MIWVMLNLQFQICIYQKWNTICHVGRWCVFCSFCTIAMNYTKHVITLCKYLHLINIFSVQNRKLVRIFGLKRLGLYFSPEFTDWLALGKGPKNNSKVALSTRILDGKNTMLLNYRKYAAWNRICFWKLSIKAVLFA